MIELGLIKTRKGGHKKKTHFGALFPNLRIRENIRPAICGLKKKKKKVSTIECLGELELNHVSKFQVQNPKTQRGTAKILISSLYFKFI